MVVKQGYEFKINVKELRSNLDFGIKSENICTVQPQISIPNRKIHNKIYYLCSRFRNNNNEMQQNRMNITATKVCRGSKRFDGVLCAPISSNESFDIIGKTIQLKHTRTRIL